MSTQQNWFLVCLIFLTFSANGQEDRSTSERINKFLSVETGGVYYGFRDHISSILFYEGFGGAHLNLGYKRDKNNSVLDDINLTIEYGESKAKVNDPNDFANIISLSLSYSKVTKFDLKKHSKIHLFLGGMAYLNGLYIGYPLIFSNNGDAYSIDLLALAPIFGINFSPESNKEKRLQKTIGFFSNIQLMSLNIRPESYSGVGDEKIFRETKFTTIHNNFRIKNTLSFDLITKNNRNFGFSYDWIFVRNNSRINSLLYAQHNLSFRYQFRLKSSKK